MFQNIYWKKPANKRTCSNPCWSRPKALVFHCCGTNYLPIQWLERAPICYFAVSVVQVWLNGILCSKSHKAKVRQPASLHFLRKPYFCSKLTQGAIFLFWVLELFCRKFAKALPASARSAGEHLFKGLALLGSPIQVQLILFNPELDDCHRSDIPSYLQECPL